LEFNVPSQHKYGYIRDERSAVESYPYPVKEGQRYINLNHGRQPSPTTQIFMYIASVGASPQIGEI